MTWSSDVEPGGTICYETDTLPEERPGPHRESLSWPEVARSRGATLPGMCMMGPRDRHACTSHDVRRSWRTAFLALPYWHRRDNASVSQENHVLARWTATAFVNCGASLGTVSYPRMNARLGFSLQRGSGHCRGDRCAIRRAVTWNMEPVGLLAFALKTSSTVPFAQVSSLISSIA